VRVWLWGFKAEMNACSRTQIGFRWPDVFVPSCTAVLQEDEEEGIVVVQRGAAKPDVK
jgi:predicted ribosome-associated RNA-binding protein Tma20